MPSSCYITTFNALLDSGDKQERRQGKRKMALVKAEIKHCQGSGGGEATDQDMLPPDCSPINPRLLGQRRSGVALGIFTLLR